ncbi:hypothetical protein ACFV1F_16895 [Streptomyces sp. NPDC059590]|uniref:hypothetical protein n=1 Tax=Streptomyces sp. NPDC059590 TaxID=3346877 RepID=UPI0036A44F98
MSQYAYAAGRLAVGSRACARRLAAGAAAWCRKSYRDDLTGWKAALGPIVRAAVLAGAGAVVCLVVHARPWLMWVLTVGWLIAAWLASRPAPGKDVQDAPENEPEQGPAVADPHAVRRLLLTVLEDQPAVHLSTVLSYLQKRGQASGWEVADLRSRMQAVGAPVKRSVRVGKSVTWGVYRKDLVDPADAPSPAVASEPAA